MTPPSRMPSHPSREMVEEALSRLYDMATCRCEPCWADRGMCAPECQSDMLAEIETLDDFIQAQDAAIAAAAQRG